MANEDTAQSEYESALTNPLGVAFPIFLGLALLADALDIVLEISGIVVIPKLIGIALDILTLPIGWWVAKRTGEIISAREKRDQMRQQQAQQREQRTAQHAQRIQAAKEGISGTRNPARKAWRKIILFFLLELIPFVGIIPFWTIAVIGTLRTR